MGVGVGLSAGPSTAAMVEIQCPWPIKERKFDHDRCPGGGIRIGVSCRRRADPVRPVSDLSEFLALGYRSCRAFRCDLVPASRPYQSDARIVGVLRTPCIPRGVRATFAVSATAVTTAYTHGVLILSLGSQVAKDLVGSTNVLVNGAALSLVPDHVRCGRDHRKASAIPGRRSLRERPPPHPAWPFLPYLCIDTSSRSSSRLPRTAGVGYSLLFLGGLE